MARFIYFHSRPGGAARADARTARQQRGACEQRHAPGRRPNAGGAALRKVDFRPFASKRRQRTRRASIGSGSGTSTGATRRSSAGQRSTRCSATAAGAKLASSRPRPRRRRSTPCTRSAACPTGADQQRRQIKRHAMQRGRCRRQCRPVLDQVQPHGRWRHAGQFAAPTSPPPQLDAVHQVGSAPGRCRSAAAAAQAPRRAARPAPPSVPASARPGAAARPQAARRPARGADLAAAARRGAPGRQRARLAPISSGTSTGATRCSGAARPAAPAVPASARPGAAPPPQAPRWPARGAGLSPPVTDRRQTGLV